jgi:hypothetical protein
MPQNDVNGSQVIDVNSHFKLIFLTVTIFTVFLILVYVALCCLIDTPTKMQEDLVGMLQLLIPLGFGSICGLLGGKSL